VDRQVDAWWVLVAAAPGVVALLLLVVLWLELRRVRREQRVILPDGGRVDIVGNQAEAARSLARLRDDVDQIRTRLGGLSDRVDAGFAVAKDRHGIERYDAFHEDGGRQSWSLAILDERGDGSVVTSLARREGIRMFLKQVRGGVADPPLSPEEERAVLHARGVETPS